MSRSTVSQGPLQAVWIGRTLVLARGVRVEEGTFLQGCWLDWDVIRRDLVEGSNDLVPHSSLEMAPVQSGPVRHGCSPRCRCDWSPGSIPDEPEPGWSPARLSLAIAWACLTLAAAAVALLLRGALALSERRGTFVSAVTHELRTPLTTFRLYTEMLDEGMVAGADSQRTYFKTLRGEADRLGHLVENVLAFARLERGRAVDGREIVSPAAMLDRLAPRLALRARQAGMELIVGPVDCQTSVRVDLSVVDQILSNLVDNAVKYAGSASDRRIHLDVAPTGRWLAVTVRDHGPGLATSRGPPAVPPIFKVGPGRRAISAGRRSRSRPEPPPRPRREATCGSKRTVRWEHASRSRFHVIELGHVKLAPHELSAPRQRRRWTSDH